MATRGCIIELKKDVCKIGYLHYGAGFASEFIQKEYIDSKYLERIFELDRESLINAMDIREYSTKR